MFNIFKFFKALFFMKVSDFTEMFMSLFCLGVATIDNAYIRTFEMNVRTKAQQKRAKLRDWVDEVNEQSEDHRFDIVGTVEAVQKTGRVVATPVLDTPWTDRLSAPTIWHAGDSTEVEDPSQMLSDPNSKIATALSNAMNRKIDDLIIAAANGTALDQDGNSNTLGAAQQVGGASTIISHDLVTEVIEVFDSNDIEEDEPKVFVIGPKQKRKLLQLMEVTSADYQTKKALIDGYLPDYLGFTWIVSNRLTSPDGGTSLYCLAFTRSAIGLHVVRDVWAKVAQDPSISFAWRIYTAMMMGAVRVEDEHIVEVRVKDAMS